MFFRVNPVAFKANTSSNISNQSRPLLIKGNHRCCSRFYSCAIYRVAMIASTIHDDLSLAPSRGYEDGLPGRHGSVLGWGPHDPKPFGRDMTRAWGDENDHHG